MPVEKYTGMPPIGGAIQFGDGIPIYDLSDTTLLAQYGTPKQLPIIGDQGSQFSCTAWAVGYTAATATLRSTGVSVSSPISPSDLFAKLRNRYTPEACTQGSTLSFAMDVMVIDGVTTLDIAPYFDSQCGIPSNGKIILMDGFSSVSATDTASIRGAIQSGTPVAFGINVNSAFQGLNSTFNIWAPDGTGGGHALAIIGYDDSKQLFKVMNSWSESWGQKGYFYISYANFAKFASDVCIPYVRQASKNALLASSKSNVNSPVEAQHIFARAYGAGVPGSYGVGAEMAWSGPLALTAASISVLNNANVALFSKDFNLSQIARGIRFGTALPDSVAGQFQLVRCTVTGTDITGASQFLTAFTKIVSR